MPSTLIDSIFLKDLYGTPEMRSVFDDLSVEQKWLDAEVALAQAEAELGVIPAYAAGEISRKARADQLDNAKMKALIDKTVHPIVPLIRVLKDRCEGDAGEYIHWGATTQDIMDTGLALKAKEAIAIFEPRLAHLEAVLADGIGAVEQDAGIQTDLLDLALSAGGLGSPQAPPSLACRSAASGGIPVACPRTRWL
jgi:hypothetical protein